MIENLLHYDTQLFLLLNSLGTTTWDSFWLLITNKTTWFPLYLLLAIGIGVKERNLWKTLLLLVLAGALIGVNDGLSNLAKHYFERPRPCRSEDILASPLFRMVAEHCSRYGYFSAHASNHFGLAVFLGYYFKPNWKPALPLFLLWAAVVAYSRIYVGVHYPLDILTGALVGCLSGYFFIKWLKPMLFYAFWKVK